MDVNPHDLEAIGDIADWLAEQSDGMSAAKAIELLQAAEVVQGKLKAAVDMLESQALRSLEQPIQVGNTMWAKRRVFKKRPNQSKIRAAVVAAASRPDRNGEVPTAEEAAERAAGLMRALYVSPLMMPKLGGVETLGLEMDDVCDDEHTGFALRRTELR